MTPEFAAWKAQVAQVALPLRVIGIGVVMLGAALLVMSRYIDQPALIVPGCALLGLGWGMAGWSVWLRTRWAKQNPYTGPR